MQPAGINTASKLATTNLNASGVIVASVKVFCVGLAGSGYIGEERASKSS